MSKPENNLNYKDWLDLYWNHFQLHSEQRMKILQFYLSLIAVLFGALFTLHSLQDRIPITEIVVCIGIAVISLFFLLIDYRTALLIKDAEEAIKEMERLVFPDANNKLALFTASAKKDGLRGYISYSKCIQISEFLIVIFSLWLAWQIGHGLF